MTVRITAHCYIVGIYRTDPDDPKKLTGVVETLDGSGMRQPFTDIIELAAVLNRSAGMRDERRKSNKP